MWLPEVDFDGRVVSGVLLNDPNWLKTVKKGDAARVPLGEISDWMYAISGEVFGAYTVNLLRSRMGGQERQQHDAAWGLSFGDPKKIRVAPESNKAGGFHHRAPARQLRPAPSGPRSARCCRRFPRARTGRRANPPRTRPLCRDQQIAVPTAPWSHHRVGLHIPVRCNQPIHRAQPAASSCKTGCS